MSGSPSTSSTSKATNTSEPAPCWSSPNPERPVSSSAQISPSITAEGERTARPTARAAGANRVVRSLSLRLLKVATPPSTRARALNPSHFGSNAQPSPTGSTSVAVASIGA